MKSQLRISAACCFHISLTTCRVVSTQYTPHAHSTTQARPSTPPSTLQREHMTAAAAESTQRCSSAPATTPKPPHSPGGHQVIVVVNLHERLDLGPLRYLLLAHGRRHLPRVAINARHQCVAVGPVGGAIIDVLKHTARPAMGPAERQPPRGAPPKAPTPARAGSAAGLSAAAQNRPGARIRDAARSGGGRGRPRRPPAGRPRAHLDDDGLAARVAAGEHQHHLPRLHKLAHLCGHSARRSAEGPGRPRPRDGGGWRPRAADGDGWRRRAPLTDTAAPMAPRPEKEARRPFT